MKKLISCISLLLIFSRLSFALDPDYLDYDWAEDPKVHELTDEEKKMDKVYLKDKKAIEYAYDNTGDLVEYLLSHTIIRVNSDKVIQENNKIYIPSGSRLKYVNHKVRVINPNGKVKVLSDDDIKEAVDEETKGTYRFFALEGIELGSEIEHLFLMKLPPSYTGNREVLQDDVLKKNVDFDLITPENLLFKIKSYNGLPEVEKDTTREDKNVYTIRLDEMPALKDEPMSTYKSKLQQLIFKLDGNAATGASGIISYGAVSNNIFNNICTSAEKSEIKKVKKLLSKIDLKYATDVSDKVRMIEHHLKTNIMITENGNPAFSSIEGIMENRVGNESGLVKLYSAIFNETGIDYQLVLTSNRNSLKFDPEFEAYNFLQSYLIYFPEIDSYLAPADMSSSLGFIPHNLTANHGLFIKKVSLNDFSTGVGKIKYIKPVPYDKNFSNHFVEVDFSENINNPLVKLENQMGGYYAQYYQPYYTIMTEENKKEVNEEIIHGYLDNAEIKEVAVENAGRDFFGVRPFIVKAELTSENLVEKAGNKYLFKLGNLIGPQMEMYQEEERKLEVENSYMRLYERKISFKLPEGYKISNPEELNMDVHFMEDGDKVAAFISTYTVDGNTYTVEVKEYYKKLIFPVSQFEDYRKVINAAADFNKITLIVEKQ